jgi:hypothetical protein
MIVCERRAWESIMSPSDCRPQTDLSLGTYTVEVFGEHGDRRAFARADSISDAMKWLDTAPVCRGPQEKLMIRIEDRDHAGCWLYVSPPGALPDWIMSAAAKQVRARVERRKGGLA